MADETWDVDVLKGIRIFFNPETEKLESRYLTSWVGYPESADEWLTPDHFSDEGVLVTTFERIVPSSFKRDKFGEEWHASEEWIESERHKYYQENKHQISDWVKARQKTADERHMPQVSSTCGLQVQANIEQYGKYLALSKKTFISGEVKLRNKLKKESLPKRTKETSQSSGGDTIKRPKKKKNSGRKGSSLLDKIEVGLRYPDHDIHLDERVNRHSDHGRLRPNDTSQVTKSSVSAPLSRIRSRKSTKAIPSSSSSEVNSPQVQSMEVDGDGLFTDPESSDEETLAAQASILIKESNTNNTKTNRASSKASITSSSDSEVPLSQLKDSILKQHLVNPEYISVPQTLSTSSRSEVPSKNPVSVHPGRPSQPKQAPDLPRAPKVTIDSRNSVEKKLHGPTAVPVVPKANITPEKPKEIHIDPNPVEIPPDVEMDTDQSLFLREEPSQASPIAMDFIEEANALIREATVPFMHSAKVEDTVWRPVDLKLLSGKGSQLLCKVRLMRVTNALPPNLKWIHIKGFEIKSWRSMTQLDILLLVFKPCQHAIVAPITEQDNGHLAAFTKFLSDNGLFALADTEYSEVKLCFYASDQIHFLNRLGIPPSSELRAGMQHLLVSVIRRESSVASSLSIFTSSAEENYDAFFLFPASSSCPAVVRGARLLRFPKELGIVFKRRKSILPVTRYTLYTAESLAFRFTEDDIASFILNSKIASLVDYKKNPTHIDEIAPDHHALRWFPQGEKPKLLVNHSDETQALIEIMKKLDIQSKAPMRGDTNIVFIHNGSWEMLKHFKGLGDRKSRPDVWFYAYGPYHALHSSLWGVRQVFKRGGILTFTPSAIWEDPTGFRYTLKGISNSEAWMAFISPLVLAMLQERAVAYPNEEKPLSALTYALEAIRQGSLIMTPAPPHPWRLDEWKGWLETMSSAFLETLTRKSYEADEAILDAAENALDAFTNPKPPSSLDCSCAKSSLQPGWEARAIPKSRTGPALEDAIDNQVFEDLRQMMLVPVIHTEYRQFVVTRNRSISPGKQEFFLSRMKDSIEHAYFSDLCRLDSATFPRPEHSRRPSQTGSSGYHGSRTPIIQSPMVTL
ncbi:hypothetical protein FRC14_005793 [Serendipita sp. 396]|nr:hypothetical protein FRC14_005793 [Serendipita sp. 396]